MEQKILEEIDKRLDLGIKRYGHSIKVSDNTINFGTEEDSWLEMMEQELLDAVIYLTAHLMRKENIQNDAENVKLRECLERYRQEHHLMAHLFYMTNACKRLDV